MDKTKLQALGALYGSRVPPTTNAVAVSRSIEARRPDETEYSHQRRLHHWLTQRSIPHYHCPTELIRDAQEGRAQSLIGTFPGVPDLCITLARKPHHGLYMELKREKGGIVSGAQQFWLEELARNGYLAIVSWHYEQSIGIVENYLALPPW